MTLWCANTRGLISAYSHTHICIYIYCRPTLSFSGVLRASFQPCSSLSICHGARINKHTWKRKIFLLSSLLLFVNGLIISEFQSVYHHHQGKTLPRFTVLWVICSRIISIFYKNNFKSSAFTQSGAYMWKSYAPFWHIMSFLNSSRHRWKCLVVGFFLLLFPSSDPPPSSSDDTSVSIHCCMFAGWQRQTELFKQRGGWCVLIWCVCVHATRTTLNKRKKGWQHPTSVCHLQCKRPCITLTSCMCS